MRVGSYLHLDLRATYRLRPFLRVLSPHLRDQRAMSSREYLDRPLHEADGPLVWIDCEMTGRPLKYSSIPPHDSILYRTFNGRGLENLSTLLPSVSWRCRTHRSHVVCIVCIQDGKFAVKSEHSLEFIASCLLSGSGDARNVSRCTSITYPSVQSPLLVRRWTDIVV
jgi:hypothetical protein